MSGLTFRQALTGLVLMLVSSVALSQRQAPEPVLKAAILVNMLLFIDWPNQAAQPKDRRVLCYLDSSPVAAALLQLEGRSVSNRPLSVQQVSIADAARLSSCHAVYLAPGNAVGISDIVPNLRAAGVLIVGDSPDYLQRGIMLNLEVESGRVVFDIDLKSARQAGVGVSSKMLRLARRVVE